MNLKQALPSLITIKRNYPSCKKGAYAIITENDITIEDKDIFYFRVENLEQALVRFLRFFAKIKNVNFYF